MPSSVESLQRGLPAAWLAIRGPDLGLANVAFHTEGLDATSAQNLRQGVLKLWRRVRPLVDEYGLTEFPRTDAWGFASRDDAAAVSGIPLSKWRKFSGFARPGKLYVLRSALGGIYVAAHEALHVIHFAVSGGVLGHACIAEGAAEWYANSLFPEDWVRPLPPLTSGGSVPAFEDLEKLD